MPFGRRIEARVSQAMSKVEHTASEADKAIIETNARLGGMIEEVKDGFTVIPIVNGGVLYHFIWAILGCLAGKTPEGDIEFPVKLRVELEEDSDKPPAE